jgi:uncharacterized protein (DUF1697 family)
MMNTYISFLRGINVSGQNRLSMPELKGLYEILGMTDVVTYIQSGNVVFDCVENVPARIEKLIEEGIRESFKCEVRVILREKKDLEKVLKGNPFLIDRIANPDNLYVTFLSDKPPEAVINNLTSSSFDQRISQTSLGVEPTLVSLNPTRPEAGENKIQDEFIICDKEVFLLCPNGYGKTKFSNSFFEKKLKVSATTRNWKTVNALFEIAERRQI